MLVIRTFGTDQCRIFRNPGVKIKIDMFSRIRVKRLSSLRSKDYSKPADKKTGVDAP